jgi:hypothetical protein
MKALFDLIWAGADGYGEIRTIQDGKVSQLFLPVQETEALEAHAQDRSRQGADVYFGVLSRLRRSGKSEDCAPETSVLWGDVDAKNFVDGKPGPLRAVNGLGPVPQVLIDSGGGLHAYWLLNEPVPFDQARRAMEYIAQAVNGDATYDAARVLRVPGTINRKYGNYARVLRLDATAPRYRISDFPVIEPKSKRPSYEQVDWAGERATPDWLIELIEIGVPRGQRSEASFKAMVWLLRYGFSRAQILAIFEDSPTGIGEKLAEKFDVSEREGTRWFDTTFKAAERVA